MSTLRKIWSKLKKIYHHNQFAIIAGVICIVVIIVVVVYITQAWVEQGSLPPFDASIPKEQYEVAKLAAEIRQIRSDTSGSLFWLKLIALLITVGGAVGGYLVGQSSTTRKRIAFEDRKNIDSIYQSIVKDLSDDKSPILLRAAAAVNLGAILQSFPSEWTVSDDRKDQLIKLAKQILAAALAVEKDEKVLKTITIALVRHKPEKNAPEQTDKVEYGVREMDLSGAKAVDAYWARIDFSYSDFYQADLTKASFRKAILNGAQFREAILNQAVLIEADCTKANFKLADLRNANLTGAILAKAGFEGTKVHGCVTKGAQWTPDPDSELDNTVDDSEAGDGSVIMKVPDWLKRNTDSNT